MARRRSLLGRFISLYGIGRLDPRRGDRSPSCADRLQSQGRAQRMAWNRRARRGHARSRARGSACGRVWRVGGALAGCVRGGVFPFCELAPALPVGIGHRSAFTDLLHHHARRSPSADRSAVVQCRGVRMDADSVPGAGGGPGGNRGSEPLFGHPSDWSRDQPDLRLLALGVCDAGRQGKDLALPWSRGVAGRRRGVVGSRSAPRAGRPRQLASYHRDRGKKCAGLSPRRKRVGSGRRPASGNPLFRIDPPARVARRAGNPLRAAAGSPVAERSPNLGRGLQADFPQAERHLARVRPSPAHRPLRVAEPHNRQDGAFRRLCR